jgi:uncharacterized iron-regulated membrane protein
MVAARITGAIVRKLHRSLMAVLIVFLLYLAVTGLIVGGYDLLDAQQGWAQEGGGPGMREPSGAAANPPALPDTAKLTSALDKALQANSRRAAELGSGNTTLKSLELRLANGAVQTLLVTADENPRQLSISADGAILSNEPAPVVRGMPGLLAGSMVPGGVGGPPPPRGESQHGRIESWHRAAYLPGSRYVGLIVAAGLVLLALTGVWMYLQLWRARRAAQRPEFFWRDAPSNTAKTWRRLHRWTAIIAAVFLLNTAVTGSLLNLGELQLEWSGQGPSSLFAPPQALAAEELPPLLERGVDVARQRAPLHSLTSVSLSMFAGQPRVQANFGGTGAGTVTVNARTGERMAGPPGPIGRGVRLDYYQFLKRLHRGDYIGNFYGRLLPEIAGLGLLYLCVSGLVMFTSRR